MKRDRTTEISLTKREQYECRYRLRKANISNRAFKHFGSDF